MEADVIDGKGFVSSSGDGDGSYACLVGRNSKGQVVSIKIDYYPEYELLEDKEEDLEENEEDCEEELVLEEDVTEEETNFF